MDAAHSSVQPAWLPFWTQCAPASNNSMTEEGIPDQVWCFVSEVDEGDKLHELRQAVNDVQQLHNLKEVEG